MATPVPDAALSATGWLSGVSGFNIAFTCTGSNRYIEVLVSIYNSTPVTVANSSYASVAMGKGIAIDASLTSARQDYEHWYLDGPASSSNTLTVNLTGTASFVTYQIKSYTGKQTVGLAAINATQNTSNSTSSPACPVTVINSDALLTGGGYSRYSGTPTAGAGTTSRATTNVGHIAGDSATAVSPGSRTLNFNVASAAAWPGVIVVAISGNNAAAGTAVGLLSETDSALALSVSQRRTLGLLSETDTALPLTAVASRTLGLLVETDTAQPLASAQQRTLGVLTESDAALPLAGGHARVLGLLMETDEALSINAGGQATVLGQLIETDSALSLVGGHARVLGQLAETDVALPLASLQSRTVGLLAETDSALPLTSQQVRALGQLLEQDSALSLMSSAGAAVGLLQEADAALSLAAHQARVLGLLAEVDAALALSLQQLLRLGLLTEEDVALALAGGAPEHIPFDARTWRIPADLRLWRIPRA